jgi:hypothetical protein
MRQIRSRLPGGPRDRSESAMFPDPRFYYFRTLWHFCQRSIVFDIIGIRKPGRVVGFHVAANDSHSVLEFPYEALVCRFRVADKEQHQNHSHKWDQPSYYHDRIEDVSRSRLPRVGKMPD